MKLAIVTVTLNDLAGLQRTLASLAGQTSRQFEQWVVDGGSTDGTGEFLARYQAGWPLHFRSEKDGGIYDGMNKGTARADGEFVWFLNAGDTVADSTTVATLLGHLDGDDTIDVLYGKVWARSQFGLRSVGGPVTAADFRANMPVCHQGIVYRRQLLVAAPYPTDYRYVSDWIVTRTLIERGVRFRHLDRPLAVYDLTGRSSRAHAGALAEMLRYEKAWGNRLRILIFVGGHRLGLWLAKVTGLYSFYKKRQHSRTPPP